MPYYEAGTYRCSIDGQMLVENKNGNLELQLSCWPKSKLEADGSETPVNADRPRTIFLTLSAAILFCVLGAVWALTQPDKKLAFGESNTLRMTVSSVADHE